MLSQVFSLRGHSGSITYILPLANELISADSNGQLIRWSLSTRRPINSWKAHNDSILTLIKLPNGHILSHSRDSHIKIWNDTTEVFNMPVNSLNFSNVVMLKNYLITPATTDANNFDVYQLDHKDSYEITRVITSFNGYKLVNNKGITDDYGGRNDLGIIMKMLVVDNILYVGYESGDLLALNIDFEPPIIITKANDGPSTGKLSAFLKQSKTVINKDPKITLVDHINIHAPNPIISLSHSNNHIIAGSTTNKLSLDHDILKLNNSGIQSILPTHKVLLIGYWNGIIEGYSDNQCVFTKKRQLPRVNILDSNKGNAKQENSLLVKLTFMVSRDKIESNAVSKYSIKLKFTDQELVFVGFEDGTIYGYIVS